MHSRFSRTILFGVGALVLAIATVAAVVASVGDGDGRRQTYDAPGGACLVGAVECDDIPGDGDAAGNACLEGSTECDDIPVDSGAVAGGTCLVGTPDCNDTPGLIREEDGS